MKIRLILFVIAMVIIGLIVWDHKRKNKKANKYLPKPYKKYLADSLPSTLPTSLGTFGEMFAKKPKEHSELRKAKSNHNYTDKIVDDNNYEHDYDHDYEFDRDYNLSKEFDEFDLVVHDKDEYSEYKAKAYSSAPPKDFSNSKTNSGRTYVKKSTAMPNSSYSRPKSDEQPMFLVTLHIKALSNRRLGGDELLQALVSSGCRYGDMDIFHRHEKASGHGGIMFSIASMVKPGTFDIDNMHEFSTPGVTLFFSAPSQFNPLVVYDLLLKTAYKLAKLLDAEILDDAREPLTNAKITETKSILENYVSVTESNH